MPFVPLNLSLRQKAVILVAVPLAFELLFVGILARLLIQSEAETFKERHARAIVAESNSLLKNFMDGGILIHLYMSTKKESILQRQQEICDEIPRQFRSLKVMAADSPRTKESVERLENACKKGLELMSAARLLKGEGSVAMNWIGSNDELATTTEQLISGLRGFVKEQEKAEELDLNAESNARLAVMQWLCFGVFLNCALAIALAIYFHKDITSRLLVLVENTKRLGRSQPLEPPVGGNDEIAVLDSVFHDVVNALDEASKRKQELVSMVTHDLRTPLTSIRSTLTLLGEGALGELPARANKKITAAESSAERLILLINDLLDIEKLEAGKMQIAQSEVALMQIFDSSLQSVSAFAEQVGVNIDCPESEIVVFADPGRIVQVIVNLLSNAIKFSPAGAVVKLEASMKNEFAEVRVIDQGKGIPESFLEKVFERFQQVNPGDETERKGTGLGLPICKAIVEAHGGQIAVASKVGAGSTFYFSLKVPPSQRAKSEDVKELEAEAAQPSSLS